MIYGGCEGGDGGFIVIRQFCAYVNCYDTHK